MFGRAVFLPPSAGSCLWKHPSILMAKVSRTGVTIFQKFPSQTLAKLFSKHCNQSSTVKKDPCMLRGNSRVMQKLAPNQDQLMKMQKFSATKCDTLVWMKEYPVWAAPRSWVRCRRASQGHYYYGRPKNFSSRAGNLTQSLTNTEG